MHCVGKVLVALGVSHTNLQLVMVSLQLYELLLMMSFHLRNAGFKLLENIDICHGHRWRIGAFKNGLSFEVRLHANHG